MSTQQPRAGRVTGHLGLLERKAGPVWYVRTRVPGRTPEQTTRLAPAHLSGGQPPAGHLTRRQAQDALADLLAEERHKVGERAYEHLGRRSPTPPPATCTTSSMSAGASAPPSATTAARSTTT